MPGSKSGSGFIAFGDQSASSIASAVCTSEMEKKEAIECQVTTTIQTERRTQYRVSLAHMEPQTSDVFQFEHGFFNGAYTNDKTTLAVASEKRMVHPKLNNTAKKGSVNGLPPFSTIPPVRVLQSGAELFRLRK